jgi:magnesium transporter
VLVDAAHYHDGACTARELTFDGALEVHHENHGFVWLSFVDPSRAEMDELRQRFGLHELAAEDILSKHERPKFETYDDDIYLIVLRTAYYGMEDARVHFGELAVFLGDTFVVSARKGGAHAQGSARESLEARPDLLAHGVSAVLWAILGKVVADIRPVVDALDENLVDLEIEIFSDDHGDSTRRIFDLRQQLAQLYRAVHPMLAPLEAVERGAYPRLEPMRPYLRDVSDDAKLLDEDILGQRDRLTAVLETNLALIAHRQNDSVRKISGWAAILAVPTLIAGVYGMNFKDMPGRSWAVGFPVSVVAMLLIASLLYAGLRRAGWM